MEPKLIRFFERRTLSGSVAISGDEGRDEFVEFIMGFCKMTNSTERKFRQTPRVIDANPDTQKSARRFLRFQFFKGPRRCGANAAGSIKTASPTFARNSRPRITPQLRRIEAFGRKRAPRESLRLAAACVIDPSFTRSGVIKNFARFEEEREFACGCLRTVRAMNEIE